MPLFLNSKTKINDCTFSSEEMLQWLFKMLLLTVGMISVETKSPNMSKQALSLSLSCSKLKTLFTQP